MFCGAAVFCFGLSSCAKDWDDFFVQHEDDIEARDAEDAAIRADLQTEIENLRTEITGKIATVEGNLHNLIEQGGMDVLGHLATKSGEVRAAIDERYGQFTQLMDQKFGTFQGNATSIFSTLEGQRQQLETDLKQAIADNNNQRAQEIQQFINNVKAMQQTVTSSVQAINSLQQEYATLIAQADQLADLEQRMQVQTQRFDDLLASLDATLQTAEEKYKAQLQVDLSSLSAAEIQDYKDKLAVMLDNLTQMQQAMAKLEDMKADAQQLVSDFESLADRSDDMNGLISDVETAYEKYAQIEDILNRIDAVDPAQYETLYNNIKSELEQAHQDMAAACSGLTDLKDYLESTRDTMASNEDECKTLAEYCEGMQSNIESNFNAIPFPS